MTTSTTLQLSGRFHPGSNNHRQAVGTSIVYPTLLPNERSIENNSMEETMKPTTVPQHISNGTTAPAVDGSDFNSSFSQGDDLGGARDLGITKLPSAYSGRDGGSMPNNRPTRESVLRRLSEALMRRSLTLVSFE